jgi:hypothetical protein
MHTDNNTYSSTHHPGTQHASTYSSTQNSNTHHASTYILWEVLLWYSRRLPMLLCFWKLHQLSDEDPLLCFGLYVEENLSYDRPFSSPFSSPCAVQLPC